MPQWKMFASRSDYKSKSVCQFEGRFEFKALLKSRVIRIFYPSLLLSMFCYFCFDNLILNI